MLIPIASLLTADATVMAILGSAEYITEDVDFDEGNAITATAFRRPYVSFSIAAGRVENYLSERPGIDMYRVQVDCYSPKKAQARSLAIAVRDAIELQAHQIGQVRTEFVHAVRLYRYSMDFSFWINRQIGSP